MRPDTNSPSHRGSSEFSRQKLEDRIQELQNTENRLLEVSWEKNLLCAVSAECQTNRRSGRLILQLLTPECCLLEPQFPRFLSQKCPFRFHFRELGRLPEVGDGCFHVMELSLKFAKDSIEQVVGI